MYLKLHPMNRLFFSSLAALLLVGQFAANAQDNKPADTTIKEYQLKGVAISARKSAIETAPGKTILNVQALAGNAGKTVLELLRNVPGLTVDGQGNISITGKQGVLVMIDGRQTYLSGTDLRDYLQGITAEELSQIEVMTQPSALYDAEGGAGLINLKTRKLRRKGLNGSATATATKSIYEVTNNTVLLNYRKQKTNWYTSLNYIHGANTVFWDQETRFEDADGNTVAHSFMHSEPVEIFDKYNVRAGADCNHSETTKMGFGISTAYYGNVMNSPISTETVLQNGDMENTIRNTNENSLRRNGGANAYLKKSFSKKSDLVVNVDYLLNTKRLYQYLATEAYKNGVSQPDQLILKSRVPINIALYSAKADHSTTLGNGMKLETGIKHSYVTVDNAADYQVNKAGSWVDDASRSNHFLYKENISAVYVNSVRKLNDHWDAQLGLRGELAQIDGLQEATAQHFYRQLPAIFPTAYISYKPDSANTLELNYGRRVQRPQYGMLNPFNYYTFYSTYQRGNPTLLPQYTHNAELKHNYRNHVITELSVSMVKDAITFVNLADNATQTVYGIPVNFSDNRKASLGLTYKDKPAPWCELMINATGMYALYKGLLNNEAVENEGCGYKLSMTSVFTMGKWGVDCHGSYLNRMAASPVSATIPSIYMSMGVSCKAFHDTTTINVSVDDPFYVYRSGDESVQPGLYNRGYLRPNSRYCTMAVTYSFGRNAERRAARNERLPEEARRM
jgi:iron complex outermembrane recepter protein